MIIEMWIFINQRVFVVLADSFNAMNCCLRTKTKSITDNVIWQIIMGHSTHLSSIQMSDITLNIWLITFVGRSSFDIFMMIIILKNKFVN